MSDHSIPVGEDQQTHDPLVGTVVAERYHVEKRLGEGGMGAVYLARHIVLEKQVALKILHGEFSSRKDLVERFLHEAKAAARIRHEHVIDISDFGQTLTGNPFFCMELLNGGDLAMCLRDEGPLAWPRIKSIFLQTCSALQAAHEKGIIHRDLKPENIFLIERLGHPDFVKVLDFGIAKLTELEETGKRLTKTGMVFGTPEYMSPEQARGDKTDHRVDVYAMGCILFQLVSGDVPFRAETFMGVLTRHLFEPVPPMPVRPDTPHGLEAVVARALEKDRDKRFASMNELAYAVDALDQIAGISYYAPGSKPHNNTGAQAALGAMPKTPPGMPSTASALTRVGTPPAAGQAVPPIVHAAPPGAAATPTRVIAPGSPVPAAPWREGPVGAGAAGKSPGAQIGVATESVASFGEPRARGAKIWVWIALGLAVAGGGVGAAIALSGRGASKAAPGPAVPAAAPVVAPTLMEKPDATSVVNTATPPDAGSAQAVPQPPPEEHRAKDGKDHGHTRKPPGGETTTTKPPGGETTTTKPPGGETTTPPPGEDKKEIKEIKDPFKTGGGTPPQ